MALSDLTPDELEELRRDALTELVNIAFGHVAGPLSELLDAYIRLNVPQVERSTTRALADKLNDLLGEEPIHMVRQAFRPLFRGESLVVLHAENSSDLGALFGISEGELHENEQRSVVLETANILTGACIGKLSELLGTTASFSPPTLVLFSKPAAMLAAQVRDDLAQAILIRTDLRIDAQDRLFGYLFILLPDEATRWLEEALDRHIEPLT